MPVEVVVKLVVSGPGRRWLRDPRRPGAFGRADIGLGGNVTVFAATAILCAPVVPRIPTTTASTTAPPRQTETAN